MSINPLFSVDSYKFSHYQQYPEGTTVVNSYGEARSNHKEIVFLGMQAYIRDALCWLQYITKQDVDEVEQFSKLHGIPFNKQGWEELLEYTDARHDEDVEGGLPIEIYSVDEGTVLSGSNVLFQIRNTDPRFYWLTSWLETALLRAIWYPTTVATISRGIKKTLAGYLKKSTGSLEGLELMLVDFGARGVSSRESAGIGGAAHLVNFVTSDTMEGAAYANEYYGANLTDVMKPCVSISVAASEHSTMTSWGKDGELEACRNMLKQFAKPGAIISVVSDSYDIYNCVNIIWGRHLKREVNALAGIGARLVVRPDSGDVLQVPIQVCQSLMENFGYTVNEKGYKVLPDHIRVLQGDGLNEVTLNKLCSNILENGLALSNFVFGMGGGLLQNVNRDTLKFAMKASAVKVNGVWREIYKDPIHGGKPSKKGILGLYKDTEKGYTTQVSGLPDDLLKLRYRNGEIFNTCTFDEIRERAKL